MWGQPDLPETLEIEGRSLPLKVKRNSRARRVILRLDAAEGAAALTLPPGFSNREALALRAASSCAWTPQRARRP
ncbi:MAG: hypothetical protein P8X61_11010 [Limibacillus sp.]